MGDFRRLTAWQRARGVVAQVYRVTRVYPRSEMYGLVSQTRRAAVSIAANIAEGRGKNMDREMCRYLGIAMGSASELECLLVLATDLEFLTPDISDPLVNECQDVQALMAALRRSLE